jgi:hypothetical protein
MSALAGALPYKSPRYLELPVEYVNQDDARLDAERDQASN